MGQGLKTQVLITITSMNIAQLIENYIRHHPSINDVVKNGLINYSALSRKIMADLGLGQNDFDAVLIAARRYARKLTKDTHQEKNIVDLLHRTKLEIKNKMVVAIFEKETYFPYLISLEKKIKKNKDTIHIVEGVNAITVILSEEYVDELKRLFKHNILALTKNLVEVILKSPKELEHTPGVMAYLYSLLGEHGINIVETMSCYTDTILVINEKDVAQTIKVLTL